MTYFFGCIVLVDVHVCLIVLLYLYHDMLVLKLSLYACLVVILVVIKESYSPIPIFVENGSLALICFAITVCYTDTLSSMSRDLTSHFIAADVAN